MRAHAPSCEGGAGDILGCRARVVGGGATCPHAITCAMTGSAARPPSTSRACGLRVKCSIAFHENLPKGRLRRNHGRNDAAPCGRSLCLYEALLASGITARVTVMPCVAHYTTKPVLCRALLSASLCSVASLCFTRTSPDIAYPPSYTPPRTVVL